MKQYDIIVIGAGFSGLSFVDELKDSDLNVLLIDKKEDLSKHIHTTGIIVHEALDEWDISAKYLKPISKVSLYSPQLYTETIDSSTYRFYLTATGEVLKEKARLVEKASNIKLQLGEQISKIERLDDGTYALPQVGVKSKYLVLANGAKSNLAKKLRFELNNKFLAGHEFEFPLDYIPLENKMSVFLHPKICKGYIGWVVPGVDSIQVGLAVNNGEKLSIDDFIRHIDPIFKFKKEDATGRRSGLIPIGGTCKKVFKDNVFIIGDSAGYVSPLTAGGIHTAMKYGRDCASLIKKIVETDEPSKFKIINNYQKTLPAFKKKHLLKFLFDKFNTSFIWWIIFKFKIIKVLGKAIFYLKKRLK